MEELIRCVSIELARNKAIAWLEAKGAKFDHNRKIEIGNLGVLTDKEVGVSTTTKPYWRIRLDFDPSKGAHFNVEWDKGAGRSKAAFIFPGGEQLIKKLSLSRSPR